MNENASAPIEKSRERKFQSRGFCMHTNKRFRLFLRRHSIRGSRRVPAVLQCKLTARMHLCVMLRETRGTISIQTAGACVRCVIQLRRSAVSGFFVRPRGRRRAGNVKYRTLSRFSFSTIARYRQTWLKYALHESRIKQARKPKCDIMTHCK